MRPVHAIRRALRKTVADPRTGQGVLALEVLSLERWLSGAIDDLPLTRCSIITATRDRPQHLNRAAQSVLGQAHEDWEWVVVNDGKRGSVGEALGGLLDDPRIRIVEANGVGLPAARNQGLDAASCDVVTYLDDDNLIEPNWLRAVSFALARQPNACWGYGARIVETPEVVTYESLGDFPYLELPSFSIDRLRSGNYIDANTIFHRRGRWRFDEGTKNHSDWELLLQLAAETAPLRVPAISCLYRTTAADRMSRAADWTADLAHIRAKHGLKDSR